LIDFQGKNIKNTERESILKKQKLLWRNPNSFLSQNYPLSMATVWTKKSDAQSSKFATALKRTRPKLAIIANLAI
jgi:hypothetical protein